MSGLTYTLLGDGTSDRLLDYPVRWALSQLKISVELGQWADLRRTRRAPQNLAERARVALELYPADLLLVHRDAEGIAMQSRVSEIRSALSTVTSRHVAIVPVRMTEAWFLHDENAIRRASGNPNGIVALSLPSPARVESEIDPKSTLENALLTASEQSGRRRAKLKITFPQMRARTAELITDFSPLRATSAFREFLSELESALIRIGQLKTTQLPNE